jgi:CheY-like chemotaxis protein
MQRVNGSGQMLSSREGSGSAPGRPGGRVLIADEMPAVRHDVAAAVHDFDRSIEVLLASSGREALAQLQQRAPTAGFLSMQLPDMSGAAVLGRARSAGVKPFSVLLSSRDVPGWAEAAIDVDAYDYLRKPFDGTQIGQILDARRRIETPARLLLVDDSALTRQLIRRVLIASRFSLQIEEADSGFAALELMKRARYDVALIDFAMNGMDGLETAAKANEISPETKLVLISASSDPALEQAPRHFNLSGFLKKPFYRLDVDLALHQAFGLRRPLLLKSMKLAAAAAKSGGESRARVS